MRHWFAFCCVLILAIAAIVTVGQAGLSGTGQERDAALDPLEVSLEPGFNGVTPTATPAPTQVPTPPAH